MFTKRLLMSSNTPINLKIIRFRSIYRRGKFYFAHLVVSWLNHGFGQEQLFHPLYAHIHAKVSIQSWYCIQYLFLFLFFLEARVVGAKNPHSAYEALFETVRVIFPWLSYDSARIQLYILGIRPPRALDKLKTRARGARRIRSVHTRGYAVLRVLISASVKI